MPTERILITVLTYPTPSRQYLETVCTGGITAEGEWRRLYPIPLRYLEGEQQFRTYNIIEASVGLPRSDRRPESRTPDNRTIVVKGHLRDWPSRADWIGAAPVFSSTDAVQLAGRSMGIIRPARVLDLDIEEDSPDWTREQADKLAQQQLFVADNKPLEKVPRKFWLHWRDGDGHEGRNRILSWEIHQTWRAWQKRYDDVDERIREKFLNDICADTSDFGLYVGNYAMHPQHFAVLGFFHPPKGLINETLW